MEYVVIVALVSIIVVSMWVGIKRSIGREP